DLKRRQKKGTFGKTPAENWPEGFEKWDAAKKVAYLLDTLDEVDARQWGQPGGVDLASDRRGYRRRQRRRLFHDADELEDGGRRHRIAAILEDGLGGRAAHGRHLGPMAQSGGFRYRCQEFRALRDPRQYKNRSNPAPMETRM